MDQLQRIVVSVAAVASMVAAASACDPGNEAVSVGERALSPQSSAYGRAHYVKSGFFLGDDYDVTWVVVSEHPDVCGLLTAYAACLPDGGPSAPDAPRLPEGMLMDLSFNSFAESGGTIEGGSGGIELRFIESRDGGVVFQDEASSGNLTGHGRAGERIWGDYDVTTDGGHRVRGSWSAERCEAMDTVLKWELYDRPRCPAQ